MLWNKWNEEMKSIDAENNLGISNKDSIWINNGVLMCTDQKVLSDFEKASAKNANPPGQQKVALITNEAEDIAIANLKGFGHSLNPFARETVGVLDTTGGVVVADNACCFALHKAKKLGVKFILGGDEGTFSSLLRAEEITKVSSIRTADGKQHRAETLIMACGGWTPSLILELDGLCGTTARSVLLYEIPKESPLRQKFSHANFPAFMFKQREGVDGGLYGFPVDHNGVLKIGYYGIKYTNPVAQEDGRDRSVPRTG